MSIILKKDILTGMVVLLVVVCLLLLGLVVLCCCCTLYNEKYYMNYTFDRLRLQIFISLAPAPLHRKIG